MSTLAILLVMNEPNSNLKALTGKDEKEQVNYTKTKVHTHACTHEER